MSKHILDRDRSARTSARPGRYLEIENAGRPHPQSKVLQRQPQLTNAATRMKRFLEIERQKT